MASDERESKRARLPASDEGGDMDMRKVSLVNVEAGTSSKLLADWLNSEGPEVQMAVDGGDFGRPVTATGITHKWRNLGSWVEEHRNRKLIEQHTCLAYVGDSPRGHVEVNVMQSVNLHNNPINAFCGVEHNFAILGNIIVVPSSRGEGIGSEMVRQACNFAFALPSMPEIVVVLVQEDYAAARRFYCKAGFVDTDLTMVKGGVIFRLVAHNRAGAEVRLVEERDAARLTKWLVAESDAVQLAVDGGDFGRPVSEEGVQNKWSGMSEWCREERSRELLSQQVFTARQSGCAIGHIEVGVMKSIDVAHNPVNAYCGLEPFALLLYIYVLPQRRGLGVGTAMVREACECARHTVAKQVVLIVAETNTKARRFYSRVGFRETGVSVEKMGSQFLLIEYSLTPNPS